MGVGFSRPLFSIQLFSVGQGGRKEGKEVQLRVWCFLNEDKASILSLSSPYPPWVPLLQQLSLNISFEFFRIPPFLPSCFCCLWEICKNQLSVRYFDLQASNLSDSVPAALGADGTRCGFEKLPGLGMGRQHLEGNRKDMVESSTSSYTFQSFHSARGLLRSFPGFHHPSFYYASREEILSVNS